MGEAILTNLRFKFFKDKDLRILDARGLKIKEGGL